MLCAAVLWCAQGPAKIPSPPKSAMAAPGQQRRMATSSSIGFRASPRFASGRAGNSSSSNSSSSRQPAGEAGSGVAAAGQQQQQQQQR
jgi:hypothetical protein